MNKPVARIYQRVSTEGQELIRQQSLRAVAEEKGYMNRPELQRMLANLNDGDTLIAEHLDRITRLPLDKAEALTARIKA
jgi:DNA invertase Pin-like site-specific DNA recombinase